jgi:hypothetical protein
MPRSSTSVRRSPDDRSQMWAEARLADVAFGRQTHVWRAFPAGGGAGTGYRPLGRPERFPTLRRFSVRCGGCAVSNGMTSVAIPNNAAPNAAPPTRP